MVWSCIKMHATHEIMNARKGLNNVPCVVWSCIKMHATHEIMNARKGLNNVLCVVWSCNKLHATHEISKVIGTRCEVCAIKWAFICTYKTKVRWIFQVFLTPQKSTALFYFFNDNGY